MKHTVIRMIALLAAVVLCLGLMACSGGQPDSSDITNNTTTTTTASSESEAATDTTADTSAEDTTAATEDATTAEKTSQTTKESKTTASTEAKKSTSTTASTQKTTTSRTKNVQGGIAHTTTASTAAPTKPQPKNPIRILAIGHSFAVDALRAHMWELLKDQGYDYVVVAYLFTPSCSLNEQWDRMQGKADHEQYCKTDPYTGQWDYYAPPNASPYNKVQFAIRDEQWDIITLQPDPDYGGGLEYWPNVTNDYANVGKIIDWINQNKTNPKAKLYYHMTWSFANDCKLWCFDERSPFKGDQMLHYRAFVDATKKYILNAHPNKFAGVIPAGTSIQNARSSKLGDVFNMPGGWEIENKKEKDGYHLNDMGDYVAALTWYAVITGKSAKTATYHAAYDAEFAILAEAVDNAVAKWDDVTQSSYK